MCDYPCSKCINSPSNCIECSSNLRHILPDCVCLDGYYDY